MYPMQPTTLRTRALSMLLVCVLCALVLGRTESPTTNPEPGLVRRTLPIVAEPTYACAGQTKTLSEIAVERAISVADVNDIVRYYGITPAVFCTIPADSITSAIAVIAEKRAKGQPIENPTTLRDRDGVSIVEKRIQNKRAAQKDITNRDYEASLASGDMSGVEPDQLWTLLREVSDTGVITADGLMTGKRQADVLRSRTQGRAAGVNNLSWTSIGPGNVGGRIRAMVIDPVNPLIMYVGGVTGGMWKTTNGGASWFALSDFMANLAIHSLVMDPVDRTILYAGTGEEFRGAGVFKSTDSGATWAQIASTANSDFYYVRRMVIARPAGVSTLIVATDTGLFVSTNAGVSWTKRITGSLMDVEVDPNNQSNLSASGYGSLAYSTNGGTSWTISTPFGGTGRVELAYATSTSGTIYASVNNNDGELWKSTNGGVAWTKKIAASLAQGDYDNTIWVDPANANAVVWGGVDLYKTSDGGTTKTQYSEWWRWPLSPHADNHLIVAHPSFNGTTNKTIFVANDGGVWKAADYSTATTTSGWQELNNSLGITQFYAGVGSAAVGRITGGTQDNGTQEFNKLTGSEAWRMTTSGDGGFSAADDTYWYGEYIYLQGLCRATWDGSCTNINGSRNVYDAGTGWTTVWKGAPYEISDAKNKTANFIAPFILDPNNTSTMIAGGRSVWRTANVREPLTNTTGPTWKAIKPAVACADAYACYITNISALAVQPSNSAVIYVGTNGDGSATYQSKLYKTTNATATTPTWTLIDTGLPDRTITRIVVDPTTTTTVYAVFGGYESGNVWRSTNGGTSWAIRDGSASLNLPDVPVYSMAIHPTNSNWLYVGTALGVFTSEDAGVTWQASNDGPVNTAVYDLQWMGSKLIAATHGRGMFTANVGAPTLDTVRGTMVNATTIDFVAVFSENVTGVDVADFAAMGTGTANGTVGSVTGSGDTYTVRVTVAGSGSIALSVRATATITDRLGSAMTNVAASDSQACAEQGGWVCPLYVTSASDSGPGTLRSVMTDAVSGSVIAFASTLEGQTITLASVITVAKPITIDGGMITTSITVSGGNATGLFRVSSGGNLTVRRLTLTGGLALFGGAAAVDAGGTLTVDRSSVVSNSAYFGGGIYHEGTVNITNSTLALNDTFQGGLHRDETGDGGAVYADAGSTLTILNSTIAYNSTGYMAVSLQGTSTIRNTIMSNSLNAAGTRADIYDCYRFTGTLTIANSADQSGYCYPNFNGDPGLGALALNSGGTRSYSIPISSAAKAVYHHGDSAICAASPVNGIDQRGVLRTAPCDIGSYEYDDPLATATPTATHTSTATATASNTATSTPTQTYTATATHTATYTPSLTATPTASHTATLTASKTATPTASQTATLTPSVTASKTPTNTATNTPTVTASYTSTNTATSTPTVTASNTATLTASNTKTSTPAETATSSATVTSSKTATATASSTPTFTASKTATSTAPNTATRSSTRTQTATNTRTATKTATRTSTSTFTKTPTKPASQTRTKTATRTRTSTRTLTPTKTRTKTRTMTPSKSPIPTRTGVVLR